MKCCIAALLLTCLTAGAKEPEAPQRVVVYLDSRGVWLHGAPLCGVREQASRLFLAEGITLDWRDGKPPKSTNGEETTVAINFRTSTPFAFETNERADALAVTYPYGKGPLVVMVFGDRVARYLTQFHGNQPAKVLGHILAHEIGHAIQGVARHFDAGHMKPRWNWQDLLEIRGDGLRFAPQDRDLLLQRFLPVRPAGAPASL
jgi:hypothetical protein